MMIIWEYGILLRALALYLYLNTCTMGLLFFSLRYSLAALEVDKAVLFMHHSLMFHLLVCA